MSYDVQVWSVLPPSLPASLPDVEKWQHTGTVCIHASQNWQIVVNSSVKVLLEDIPENVAGMLPGICYLTELNLEPISAPKSAHSLLSTVSKHLAKTAHGVVVDPQTDTVIAPAGAKRYRPQPREERFSVLTLSWWFTEGPLLTGSGVQRLIELLERMLPEAMPRRYGLVEPPQHLYTETGREHFMGFLLEHLDDVVVWYPHRPVASVHIRCWPQWGAARLGFRANYVEIGVETKALEQPGWSAALDRFWRAACQRVQPFYGDVRTLNGFVRMGATYGGDIETESHPVKGPWWTGIPRLLGHAAVLGEPYLDLWPRFVEAAQVVGGLAFLSTDDWTTQEEVSSLVGGVPEAIAQRWIPVGPDKPDRWEGYHNTEYPPKWPFADPRLDG